MLNGARGARGGGVVGVWWVWWVYILDGGLEEMWFPVRLILDRARFITSEVMKMYMARSPLIACGSGVVCAFVC